ncbi:MAG: helicase associated domain-containing protein [Bacteroidota bacterium]
MPDYVFEPDYELRSLQETKEYISEYKHLPEIPSAKEMEANGVDLGDMNMRLLKKIEELTLHQIELLERLEKQQEQINELKKSKLNTTVPR